MQEFRVEKERARVTIKLHSGTEIEGHLFVPADADTPTVTRVHRLLNSTERFLPVELSNGQTMVQNKRQMQWCRFEGPVGPVLEVLLPRRRVTFVLDDETCISGDLVADGPPDQRRVLDCLNRADPFLLVEARDADYVLCRDAIAVVPSDELGEPRDEPARDAFELESVAAQVG